MATATVNEKHSEESRPQSERTRGGRVYRPNVDILEKQEELLVLADMPGVKGSEIDIRFEDGELSIYGPAPTRQEGARYLLQEYDVGDFYRTFRVSEHVDASKISAEYKDGVLMLHLPKVESAKPRKIKVKTKGS
jgi:HSP20 family protein